MNHARTVCQCDICVASNIICLFMLLLTNIHRIIKERFIFFVFQLFSRISFQDFIGFYGSLARLFIFLFSKLSKYAVKQSLRHIISVAVSGLHFGIGFSRIDAERHVRRQRPRRRGPCKDISVFVFYLKPCHGRTFLNVFIPLCNFMGRKRRAAARTVRYDLKTLI